MSRIIIKVKAKDLEEVMSKLSKSNDFIDQAEYTLEVGIKDCKENYQYLVSSDKILDWDFLNEGEDIENNTEEIIFKNSDLQEIYEYFNDDILDTNHKLGYLLNLVYLLKKETSGLRFTKGSLHIIEEKYELSKELFSKVPISILPFNYEVKISNNPLEDLITRIVSNWKIIDNKADALNNYLDLLSNL